MTNKVTSAKILLLDDDQELREQMVDYFTPRGYAIVCYPSAEEGLNELIRQSATEKPIDLVITAFRLPNMNGIEFIEKVTQVAPETPTILITGHGNLEIAVDAMDKGAFDYLVKPVHFGQLSISIERGVHFSRLQRENRKLRLNLDEQKNPANKIIAKSRAMISILDLVHRIAKSDATVLVRGDSGTGKEVIAHEIHRMSKRAHQPFIAINCSAIPEALLESELFGHAKGSFTGADGEKIGLFEEADGGTLFLDEIGDLSLSLQAKLLRVLQEWKIKRVGENQYRDINIRLLSATHKNLNDEVKEGRFREDLLFRLNVIPVTVPSLKDRKEDILPLADYFLRRFVKQNETSVKGFSKKALEYMLRHAWPGNVRELENTIERAVVLCDGPEIREKHLKFPLAGLAPEEVQISEEQEGAMIAQLLKDHDENLPAFLESAPSASVKPEVPSGASIREPAAAAALMSGPLLTPGELVSLATVESRYIQYVLAQVNFVKDRAAKILKVDRKTLYRKLESMDLNTTRRQPPGN